MSYDIRLCDPVTGNALHLDTAHMMRGGTFAVGGTTEMWLNVTYNYAKWYYAIWPGLDGSEDHAGIRVIYGLTGAEAIPVLEHGISVMSGCEFHPEFEPGQEWVDECNQRDAKLFGSVGTMTLESYWCPTREHALRPLHQLLAMSRLRPDGIWDGD